MGETPIKSTFFFTLGSYRYGYIVISGPVKVFASNTARVKQLVVAAVKKIGSQSWDVAINEARNLPMNSIVPGSTAHN